jgi:hypothetical protein
MMRRFRNFWKYVRPVLAPVLVLLLAVVTLREPVLWWLGGEERYDEEALKEWLLEAKNYQTLPQLVEEYLATHDRQQNLKPDSETYKRLENDLTVKREEIEVHLKAMGDPPTKTHRDRLPLFPVVYRLEVRFAEGLGLKPRFWDSARPRHAGQYKQLTVPLGERAWVDLQYQLRVYARQQYNERQAVGRWLRLSGLAVVLTLAALGWVYLVQRRESERERRRVRAEQQVSEAERLRLQEELRRQEAERRREEAERTALELKSQLFANIGIMAGS